MSLKGVGDAVNWVMSPLLHLASNHVLKNREAAPCHKRQYNVFTVFYCVQPEWLSVTHAPCDRFFHIKVVLCCSSTCIISLPETKSKPDFFPRKIV